MSETRIISRSVVDLRGVRTKAMEARLLARQRLYKERLATVPTPIAEEHQKHASDASTESRLRASFPGLLRVAAIVLTLGAAVHYLPTVTSSLAYFSDTEGAPSSMSAALLGINVADPGGPLPLSCGASIAASESAVVHFESLEGSVPFSGSVRTSATFGSAPLCEDIELNVDFHDTLTDATSTLYTGSISGFTHALRGTGDVTLTALLDDEDGPYTTADSCTIELAFAAYSTTDEYENPGGFRDFATTTVSFSIESNGTCPGPCEPTCPEGGCVGDVLIDVENNNEADVTNVVDISTNTGGNSANGGAGGNGGTGGGNGAPGGNGGTITTGNSTVNLDITQTINANNTEITLPSSCAGGCGSCSGTGCGDSSSGQTPTQQSFTTNATSNTNIVPPKSAAELAAQIRAEMDERLRNLRR